jgi:molecular chaperone Hsp33
MENQLKEMSRLLLRHERLEDLMETLFKGNFQILETIPAVFKCPCNKESFARGIATLGAEEIEDIIETDGKAEVVCHYCRSAYNFDKDELKNIKEGLR